MQRRNPEIPENILIRYRRVLRLAEESPAKGDRAAAGKVAALMLAEYPGIDKAVAPPMAAPPRVRWPEQAPRETKEVRQPNRVLWMTLIPDLPLGTAAGFLGIRADGMVDVFTKDIYKASTPALALGVHLIYMFVQKEQPMVAERVASKHFVIVAQESDKKFKYIRLPRLAAMVGYTPSDDPPHAPFGEEPMDPDDFE